MDTVKTSMQPDRQIRLFSPEKLKITAIFNRYHPRSQCTMGWNDFWWNIFIFILLRFHKISNHYLIKMQVHLNKNYLSEKVSLHWQWLSPKVTKVVGGKMELGSKSRYIQILLEPNHANLVKKAYSNPERYNDAKSW